MRISHKTYNFFRAAVVPVEFIAHNTSDTELSIILDNSTHPERYSNVLNI